MTADAGDVPDVAICVATYLRPTGLDRLLTRLGELRVPDGLTVEVVVVDNDAERSAEAIVDACEIGLPVRYVVEPERGISQARNRAMLAAARSEFVVFIDDDTWPEPDWLERVVETQARCDADAVLGPTTPEFESPPPAWVVDGGHFEAPRHKTGAIVPYWLAHTSGVLIRTSAFKDWTGSPFDTSLGLTGGEDTTFFWQLTEEGRRLVWDDGALIHEFVPSSKARLRWILRRAFRVGITESTLLVTRIDSRWHRRVRRVARGSYHIVQGAGAMLLARSKTGRVRGLQMIASGLGEGAGVFGYRYNEYRLVQGQ